MAEIALNCQLGLVWLNIERDELTMEPLDRVNEFAVVFPHIPMYLLESKLKESVISSHLPP